MVEKCGEHTLAANEEEKMLLVKYRERRIAVVFVDAHGSFTNTTEGLIRGLIYLRQLRFCDQNNRITNLI